MEDQAHAWSGAHRTSERRILASPLVRRIAAERGLDLSRITGSGPGGRIVETDLPAVEGARAAPKPDASGAARDLAHPAVFRLTMSVPSATFELFLSEFARARTVSRTELYRRAASHGCGVDVGILDAGTLAATGNGKIAICDLTAAQDTAFEPPLADGREIVIGLSRPEEGSITLALTADSRAVSPEAAAEQLQKMAEHLRHPAALFV